MIVAFALYVLFESTTLRRCKYEWVYTYNMISVHITCIHFDAIILNLGAAFLSKILIFVSKPQRTKMRVLFEIVPKNNDRSYLS